MYTAGKKLKSPMATCGGAAGQLRESAREAVKGLIPRKMETPMVGWRLGAVHEDVGLAVKRRSLVGRGVY